MLSASHSCGSHSGSSFCTIACEALAENLDLDLGAGSARSARSMPSAIDLSTRWPKPPDSRLADDLAVMPERRHVGRVAFAGVFDDQRDEALLHALLLLVLQRRLAAEIRLVPFDEALEPALQDRVVGRQVAASRRGSPFPAAANPARTCRTVSARASGRPPTPRRRSSPCPRPWCGFPSRARRRRRRGRAAASARRSGRTDATARAARDRRRSDLGEDFARRSARTGSGR